MSVMADRAWQHVQHLRYDDEADELLEQFIRALLDPAERLSLVAHGDEDADPIVRPWQALTDPAVAPLWALPIAAAFCGGEMPVRGTGETDEDYTARAREELLQPRGMRRGSVPSMITLAQAFLTGTKAVTVTEFYGGSEWELLLVVYDAEIDDDGTALDAAVNADEFILAGCRINVRVDPGWSWDQAEAFHAGETFAEVEAQYATYNDTETVIPEA